MAATVNGTLRDAFAGLQGNLKRNIVAAPDLERPDFGPCCDRNTQRPPIDTRAMMRSVVFLGTRMRIGFFPADSSGT